MSQDSERKRKLSLVGTKFLLSAQDMDRALAFYRDVIGLEVRKYSRWWSELTHGTAIIALHGGGTGEFRRTEFSFTVDDIQAACTAVASGGGNIRSDPEVPHRRRLRLRPWPGPARRPWNNRSRSLTLPGNVVPCQAAATKASISPNTPILRATGS